jgi:hypothetical protein
MLSKSGLATLGTFSHVGVNCSTSFLELCNFYFIFDQVLTFYCVELLGQMLNLNLFFVTNILKQFRYL